MTLKDYVGNIKRNRGLQIAIASVTIILLIAFILSAFNLPFVAVSPDIEEKGVAYGETDGPENNAVLDYVSPGHRGSIGIQIYQTRAWNHLDAPDRFFCEFFWKFKKGLISIDDLVDDPPVHFFVFPMSGSTQHLTIKVSFYTATGDIEESTLRKTMAAGTYYTWSERTFSILDYSGDNSKSLAKISFAMAWPSTSSTYAMAWLMDDLFIGTSWDTALITLNPEHTTIEVGGLQADKTITQAVDAESEQTESASLHVLPILLMLLAVIIVLRIRRLDKK